MAAARQAKEWEGDHPGRLGGDNMGRNPKGGGSLKPPRGSYSSNEEVGGADWGLDWAE